MECILLVADDDGVTGVVAPVEFDDIVNAVCDEVCGFTLALIAPLGSHNHYGRHWFPLLRPEQLAKSTDYPTIWPVSLLPGAQDGT